MRKDSKKSGGESHESLGWQKCKNKSNEEFLQISFESWCRSFFLSLGQNCKLKKVTSGCGLWACVDTRREVIFSVPPSKWRIRFPTESLKVWRRVWEAKKKSYWLKKNQWEWSEYLVIKARHEYTILKDGHFDNLSGSGQERMLAISSLFQVSFQTSIAALDIQCYNWFCPIGRLHLEGKCKHGSPDTSFNISRTAVTPVLIRVLDLKYVNCPWQEAQLFAPYLGVGSSM